MKRKILLYAAAFCFTLGIAFSIYYFFISQNETIPRIHTGLNSAGLILLLVNKIIGDRDKNKREKSDEE